MVALEGVAQLLDLLGGAAGLVDQIDLDLQAAEADLVVGLDHAAGVERVDHRLGAVPSRLAEGFRRRPGEKGDHAELEDLLVLGRGAGRACADDCRSRQQANRGSTPIHDCSSHLAKLIAGGASRASRPRLADNVHGFSRRVHDPRGG